MLSRSFLRNQADTSVRRTYDLIDEPSGAGYAALVDAALAEASTGVVTVLRGAMSSSGQQVIESLRAHLVGPVGHGPAGAILRFHLTAASAAVLRAAADSLFAWQSPALPENLCFLRADGSPWLVSVSSQRLASMELTHLERLRLTAASPSLGASLVHEAGRDALLAGFERSLERHAEAVVRDLTAVADGLLGSAEGRDGVADALARWLESSDEVRVAIALEVAGRTRLHELRPVVERLRTGVGAAQAPARAGASVLGERWRARRRRLLDEVLSRLTDPG